MAVIDVPMLGLDAASELGIALERVVSISTGRVDAGGGEGETDGEVWADVVAAAADGFEVLMTRVPADVRVSTARRVATRLQQRGVVLVVLGDPGVLVCDGVVHSDRQVWSGVGAGWGRLEHRSVEVTATGRRLPGQRCRTFEFPLGAAASERAGFEATSPEHPVVASDSGLHELQNAG